jgi:hypothetical protein
LQLHPVTQKLSFTQETFLQAADGVVAPDCLKRPGLDCWSAGHLVAHFVSPSAELWRLPIESFKSSGSRGPSITGCACQSRSSQSSHPPDELVGTEIMITELPGVRERTLAFLEETRGRDLSRYIWQHPFLGYLNFQEWFSLLRRTRTPQQTNVGNCAKSTKRCSKFAEREELAKVRK